MGSGGFPGRALVVCALAVGLAASGCTADPAPAPSPPFTCACVEDAINVDTKGTAPTPALPVEGARGGGTLFVLETAAPEHLDPQQISTPDARTIGTVLFRQLTNYIEDPKGGRLGLVGDLATNTGETADGGRTWTYHLRDNITFSDGTPITSKDIAYGIARSFGPYGHHGPQLVQDLLDPPRGYPGPDAGNPPGVTTPDDRTIRFALSKPHPEWPFLMALPTSTPVPRARDTGASYESEFVASGPYMVDGHGQTTTLVLTKNPNWDPGSDPIRHQYLDSIVVDFHGGSREEQTNRLIADRGNDQYAVATTAVAPSKIEKTQIDPGLKARTGSGPTLTVDYIHINTSRVTDVKVRQTLNWSFDRKAFVVAAGGTENDAHEAHPATLALPATWILAPVIPGWKDFNVYKSADDHGDVEKAKDLLVGDTPTLTYCFPDTPAQQPFADVVRSSLARAGFHITLRPIDPPSYDTAIGDVTNRCDLMHSSWTAAYPDARSTLDPLMNGEHIAPTGNHNYSLFNEPKINKKLDDLNTATDLGQVGSYYGNLDQEIMTIYAPLIPTYTPWFFNLHGSKAHAFPSPLYAEFNLVSAWVG